MKKYVSILAVIILLILVIFGIVSSVMPLFAMINGTSDINGIFDNSVGEGEYVEGKIYYSTGEFLEITHIHLLGFLPMVSGNEHYYLAFNKEVNQCLVIRAEKGWDKQFINNTNENGVLVKGVTDSLSSDIKYRLEKTIDQLNSSGLYPTTAYVYVNCLAVKHAVMVIIACAVAVISVMMLFLSFKINRQNSIGLIAFLILAADILYSINLAQLI